MQTEYTPADYEGKFAWQKFVRYPGPNVLPICYFMRLKAGTEFRVSDDPNSLHWRYYDSAAEAVADLDQAKAQLEEDTRGIGTPISQLSGRPGEPGYGEFCRIASTWGH